MGCPNDDVAVTAVYGSDLGTSKKFQPSSGGLFHQFLREANGIYLSSIAGKNRAATGDVKASLEFICIYVIDVQANSFSGAAFALQRGCIGL